MRFAGNETGGKESLSEMRGSCFAESEILHDMRYASQGAGAEENKSEKMFALRAYE